MVLLCRTLIIVTLAACAAPPPPTLTLTAQQRGVNLHQGEVVVLTISADAPVTALRARAFDRTIMAVRINPAGAPANATNDMWRVLVGIDLDAPLGTHTVHIEADSPTGPAVATHTMVVVEKTFSTRRLSVNPDFVNPPAAMSARITAEAVELNALWNGEPTSPIAPALTFAPAVPHRANSAFGQRSIFNGQPRGAHGGADFLSPTGTPVRAPSHGTVVLAKDLYYTGGTVILDHGIGLYSLFAHLSAITSKTGDLVEPGVVVGRVGATGRVTGAHLHWTVRLNGARVDPLALLELLPAR
jgi:murein DD-endopeptidase MepM/ murein hydrolase activator NlpD